MKNARTIENLNKAVRMEISALHQYQLHAHVLDDWGLDLLAAKMREEVAEETVHSDRFIERVIFLKGEPEIAFAKPPHKANSLTELFQADLADEQDAIDFYIQAARAADEEGDIGSRTLFEEIALDEESHKAWLEQQLDLLDRIGEQNYSAKYVSSASAQV